ncbi:MAG TPA: response regulator transcription factor [Acidobacteriota bacterium]|nr:response regulator transcription factor [Acidobacteriota bacterium]
MIRVHVCAKSMNELERIEALVTLSLSLELAGSTLGRAGLVNDLVDSRPDVILARYDVEDLESEMPGRDANPVARVLLATEMEFPLALIAAQSDEGIRGVLALDANAREIKIAIEAAAEGLLVFHPEVLEHLAVRSETPSRPTDDSSGRQLSPREGEILNMLASGLGNKEIAWRLKISEHTVKFHVTSIFHKLNASSRAQAVALGARRGLIIL